MSAKSICFRGPRSRLGQTVHVVDCTPSKHKKHCSTVRLHAYAFEARTVGGARNTKQRMLPCNAAGNPGILHAVPGLLAASQHSGHHHPRDQKGPGIGFYRYLQVPVHMYVYRCCADGYETRCADTAADHCCDMICIAERRRCAGCSDRCRVAYPVNLTPVTCLALTQLYVCVRGKVWTAVALKPQTKPAIRAK